MLAILREPCEVRNVNVSTVAVEKYFYKIRRSNGEICDDLEDALAEFDGSIPQIVAKAASGLQMSTGDLEDLRMLYSNLVARGQLGRDSLIGDVSSARERIEREFAAEFPQEALEKHRSLLDGIIRSVFDHPEGYATDPETVSRLALVRLAVDFKANMPGHVCVLESPNLELITSDAPFSWFDPMRPPDQADIDGPSFLAPRVELTFPISRHHAVMFANVPLPERVSINDYAGAILNSRTVFFARRMVLAHPSGAAAAVAYASVADYRSLYTTPLLDAFKGTD